MNKPKINIISSIGDDNIIGNKKEMNTFTYNHSKRFKLLTDKSPIIMGRVTQDRLLYPIEERVNIVLSNRSTKIRDGFVHATSIKNAIEIASSYDTKNIYVIGGQSIYEQFLPFTDNIYITEIYHTFKGNKYFPELNFLEWELTDRTEFNPDSNNNYHYAFVKYVRKK